jgi:hypothetical protein
MEQRSFSVSNSSRSVSLFKGVPAAMQGEKRAQRREMENAGLWISPAPPD